MLREPVDELSGPAAAAAGAGGAVVTDAEAVLAEVLAGVLGLERVPIDSHFFDDLGADSMVLARFCARVRKRPDLPPVSMKDVYQHPTVSGLAGALAPSAPAPAAPEPAAVGPLEAGLAEVLAEDRLTVEITRPLWAAAGRETGEAERRFVRLTPVGARSVGSGIGAAVT